MDYYEETLHHIQTLIDANEIEEAGFLLKKELRMPYIPEAYEKQFQELYKICKPEDVSTLISDEDVHKLLLGNEEELAKACEYLQTRNIRDYIKDIEFVLSKPVHPLLRANLLEIMKQQQVSDEITIEYESMELYCIPIYMESIDENEYVDQAINLLQDYIMNDNPSLFQLCAESLVKEVYYRQPLPLQEDEVPYIVYAILTYVYNAFDDSEGLVKLLEEKDLAMYGGYELLLYRYDNK